MNIEPAKGVLLVLDPLQCCELLGDGVTVKGPDAVAEESVRPGVDHVVPKGR